MADHYIVKDGVWKKINDSQFEEEFGYTPTTPRPTEKLFNGRYEASTFNTGSVSATTGYPTNPGDLVNNADTVFSISGSM
tara:strand:+ start:200 stop:439 length:240 start_codon:yes stop_codon:yes gene_type:complete